MPPPSSKLTSDDLVDDKGNRIGCKLDIDQNVMRMGRKEIRNGQGQRSPVGSGNMCGA